MLSFTPDVDTHTQLQVLPQVSVAYPLWEMVQVTIVIWPMSEALEKTKFTLSPELPVTIPVIWDPEIVSCVILCTDTGMN